MAQGDIVDKLIRSTLHAEIDEQEPSPAVREALLAAAAAARDSRLPVLESIPALVRGLRETDTESDTLHWWEMDRCQNENFASWNQPWQIPVSVYVQLYEEVRRCRPSGAAG